MTPSYASPEQFPGSAVSWRQNPFAVDAWAIGIMTLELLSGKIPRYDPAAKRLIVDTTPAWITADESGVAKGLWQLGLDLTASQPRQRPSMTDALLSGVFESDTSSTGLSKQLGARFIAVQSLLQRVPREKSMGSWTKRSHWFFFCFVFFVQERKAYRFEQPFQICVPAADRTVCRLLLSEMHKHIASKRSLAVPLVCQLGLEDVPFGRLVEIFFTHASACGLLCRYEE